MEVSEIKDRQSLQAWLEALPQGTEAEKEKARRWAVAIAHRAAMRVLPIGLSWRDYSEEKEADNAFRLLTLSFATCTYQIVERIEVSFFEYAILNPDQNPIHAAYCSATTIGKQNHTTFSDAAKATPSTEQAGDNEAKYAAQLWAEVRDDLLALEEGSLEGKPLWAGKNPVLGHWEIVKAVFVERKQPFSFWGEWYDNALHGRPQDNYLLTKIALIDPKVWDKGADHVNALIQQIVEQHRLAGEARALKAEVGRLKAELQSVRHRSHNNPPEMVDETKAAQKSVTIIWAALDEAEKELEKPTPDPGRLASIGRLIFDAIKTVGGYCASLADSAITASVKTVATGTTALLLAAHNERLLAFVEALGQFARSLGK